MEKIEKLEEFNWVSGRDAITIALCNTIIRKQNEIIDHLNSQDQEGYEKRIRIRGELSGETEHIKAHKEYLATSKQDTSEEWVCPKCGFDDCYPYKNSEDFGLMYCPACSELVKLNSKKK